MNQPAKGALSSDTVISQLDRIVASRTFATSPQLCRFLRFVVEQELAGKGDQLKELSLGLEVFGKDESFDPRIDPIVRTEARRLRHKLTEYYQTAGLLDSIEIDIPKGGYRPVFRSRTIASSPATPGLPSRIWAAVLLTVSAAAFYWLFIHDRDPQSASIPRSIAVLPLENLSADPEQEYFSDGMTDALITDLAKIRGLRVISRTSVLQYKRTKKPLTEIARRLGVDYVVEGTILRAAGRVRITAQLIVARNERHLWAESYERDPGDALVLQGEVARAIAGQVNIRVTAQERERLALRALDPEAQENYLKGRFYWHSRNLKLVEKSVDYFSAAIGREPGYALAYAALCDGYQVLAAYQEGPHNDFQERARAAAKKAIELDANLGEAHACLGAVYHADWQWQSAEREFRKAIELSPSYPTAHSWYAALLGVRGRAGEAVAEARLAVDLDPLSPAANSFLGIALFDDKQYDAAIRQLQQTVEAFPGMVVAHIYLALAYAGKGKYLEAIDTAQQALNSTGGDPDVAGVLGYVQAATGSQKEPQRLLDDLNRRQIGTPFILAGLYLDVGDRERALAWLEEGVSKHSRLIELIGISPVFVSLHTDARFASLLKKMNLSD